MHLQNSCIEGMVPMYQCSEVGPLGGDWSWPHQWDNALMDSWFNGLLGSGGNFRRWALLEEVGSWGTTLEGYILAPSSLSLLPGHYEVKSFAAPHALHLDVLPDHNPETMELGDHRLNLLKLWANISLFAFKLILICVFSQQ
jgi:hypothetical protein